MVLVITGSFTMAHLCIMYIKTMKLNLKLQHWFSLNKLTRYVKVDIARDFPCFGVGISNHIIGNRSTMCQHMQVCRINLWYHCKPSLGRVWGSVFCGGGQNKRSIAPNAPWRPQFFSPPTACAPRSRHPKHGLGLLY